MPDSDYTQLIKRALDARRHAHAPYSRFGVAAALLAADGAIHVGVNVENASYGLTICAERAAVFSAVAAGQSRFAALAVASPGGEPPCGACRQVLAEFCDDLPVILVNPRKPDVLVETSLARLLPDRFPRHKPRP